MDLESKPNIPCHPQILSHENQSIASDWDRDPVRDLQDNGADRILGPPQGQYKTAAVSHDRA